MSLLKTLSSEKAVPSFTIASLATLRMKLNCTYTAYYSLDPRRVVNVFTSRCTRTLCAL